MLATSFHMSAASVRGARYSPGGPNELIEAVRINGVSELRIVFGIVAPNVLPAVATLIDLRLLLPLEQLGSPSR
jgi:ABC-type glycerol-3-phosphate transport system permease component